jgi:hypothetical protein
MTSKRQALRRFPAVCIMNERKRCIHDPISRMSGQVKFEIRIPIVMNMDSDSHSPEGILNLIHLDGSNLS